MTVLFRINQAANPTPIGILGRARDDIMPFTGANPVEFVGPVATTYLWELYSYPPLSTATVIDPTSQTCYVEMIVPGGYLMRCTVDAGLVTEDVTVLYVGIPLAFSGLPIPALDELNFDNSKPGLDGITYDGSRGTSHKLEVWYKWVDANIVSGHPHRKVINIVDGTAAPPTEVVGDRYILDDTPGVIHPDWDGAAQNDIVEFIAGVWADETPEEGDTAYVDAKNVEYQFIDDGTPKWEPQYALVSLQHAYGDGPTIAATSAVGAIAFSVADNENIAALTLTQSDSTNDPNALIISNAGSGAAISLQGAGSRLINSDSGNLSITTTTSGTLALNSVGALTLDAAVASHFSVASADLTLATTTSGKLSVTSAGALDIDGLSTTLDSTTLSIDSTDTTNFTMTANAAGTKTLSISVSNIGAGVADLTLDADGGISIDANAASNLSATAASLTLSTIASGTLFLTSAVLLDIDSASFDADIGIAAIDASTLSIDSTDTTNLTMTANAAGAKILTIYATNAGVGDGTLSLYGDILVLYDASKAGSTYSTDLVLSDSSAEWSTFETNYGEVSLLNAINQAGVFELGVGTLSAQRKGASLSTLGDYAVNTGYGNVVEATADYSAILGGKNAVARWPYAIYHASGAYSEGTVGDSQVIVDVPMLNRTDNDTWTQLYIDGRGGSGLKLTAQPDGLYQLRIMVTANCTNYTDRYASYSITALVNNSGGTTTLLNYNPTIEFVSSAGTESSWDVRVTANDVDDTIQVEVLGTHEERIRWQASVRAIEVIRKDPVFGWVATGAITDAYRLDDLCVNGGVLYASGIINTGGNYWGNVWSYDPSLDTWTSCGHVGAQVFFLWGVLPYYLVSLGGVLYCSVGCKQTIRDVEVYSLTLPSTWVSCGLVGGTDNLGVTSFATDGTYLYQTNGKSYAESAVYKRTGGTTWVSAGDPGDASHRGELFQHGTTLFALVRDAFSHANDTIKTYAGGTSWTDVGKPTYSNAGFARGAVSDGVNLYIGHVPDSSNKPEIFAYSAPSTWVAKGVLSANGATLQHSLAFNSGELFAGSTSDFVDKFIAPSTWTSTGRPEIGSDAVAGASLSGNLYFAAGTTVYVRVTA